MLSGDKKKMIKRYIERYNKFGYSPLSLGWGKGGRQEVRFSVLSEIGIQNDSSVLDVGCGFCDLYDYLAEHNWKGRYVGIDLVDDFLKHSKNRHSDLELYKMDILEENIEDKFDFVVASGIFNYKLKDEENYQYICKMLTKMASAAKVGVAADFQSSYVDYQLPETFHAEPNRIFDLSHRISKRIVLRHDYMPFEFAIYIFVNDRISDTNVFVTR